MDINFDKNDLKSVLYYLKDTYGMRCFKDRRFIWMIPNLMPDREKYIGLDSLDYDGTLMKIINNISSDLQKKIKIIEEAKDYNFKLHLDKDGNQLSILTDVIDYFSDNHQPEEELTESELKPYFDELLTKLKEDLELYMVRCTAGSFIMGSHEDELGRMDNELQHKVTISKDFYIAVYLTSCNQMRKHGEPGFYGEWPNSCFPVNYVSKDDAINFLENLNKEYAFYLPPGYAFSLPTEAQWEYACRAGSTTSLNNNLELSKTEGRCPNLSQIAWYEWNGGDKVHDSGRKKPNNWGLYDMLGNLWEWCYDLETDYRFFIDNYKEIIDPIGTDGPCVIRGGSAFETPRYCRCARRQSESSGTVAKYIGFRTALTPVHDHSGKTFRIS
jgi:formylglycine-generating enzyme required for sulfatase activity